MNDLTLAPWIVDLKGDYYGPCIRRNGMVVCKISQRHNGTPNAAFIVRACNAHDELVRAAQAMVDYSRAEVPTDHATPKELLHVRSMLVAALTKAEEPCGY